MDVDINKSKEIHDIVQSFRDQFNLNQKLKKISKDLRDLTGDEHWEDLSLGDEIHLHIPPEFRNISSSEFRSLYKKRVGGVTKAQAYRIITGGKYVSFWRYILKRSFRFSFISLIIVLAIYGATYIANDTYNFLRREWRWWIPVFLPFVYFLINLMLKNNK